MAEKKKKDKVFWDGKEFTQAQNALNELGEDLGQNVLSKERYEELVDKVVDELFTVK